jgi:peptidase M28-like protein
MTRVARRNLFYVLLVAIVASATSIAGYLLLVPAKSSLALGPSTLTLADIPFDGAQAYQYLQQICAIGPRPSGTPAMQQQQRLLIEHFRKLGGQVQFQEFRARHPQTGGAVPMANLIVHWHPERKERILLAAHYDTRPFPDQDRENPRGVFIGANDGGSGVAVLMELGRAMPRLKGKLGVDFVLFDGEELVYQDGDAYFLGSDFFAQDYVTHPPDYRYRWAVLLDMIGDSNLQIYYERNSLGWKDSKPLATAIWDTAKRLGVHEFIPSKKFEVRDDHLALHNIAKIPSCDIIDLDYPYWHTRGDTPEKCSALSLAKVGWVMQVWLEGAVR